MQTHRYTLQAISTTANQQAISWLKLGILSLAAAGIFSILLVLSRTPAIQEIIPFTDFFHIALVVHVDLSVLIWFLSCAGLLWSLVTPNHGTRLDRLPLALALAGSIMIIIAPFIGIGAPLMNNYVPVLDHPFYLSALCIFGAGMLVQLLLTLIFAHPELGADTNESVLKSGAYLAAAATLAAFLGLLLSYLSIPPLVEGHGYYEILFWGGGHILQFAYTLLVLMVWLWLSDATGARINLGPSVLKGLMFITVAPILYSIWVYSQFDVLSPQHRLGFTDLMTYGGLASLPLGLIITQAILRAEKTQARDKKPIKAALLASITLFAAGGVIGFMIEGVNVVIPAHYHGSIVGITLAFMGLTYYLLPQFGYAAPDSKTAHWQPYIYGGGQLMHILGLAWSGGYGVQRKTAGAAQGLDRLPEIAGMGMMGLGGAISIIGGFLFVIIAIKAFNTKSIN